MKGPSTKLRVGMSSISTSRASLASLAGQHFGGDRNLYEVLGYPRAILPEEYHEAYLRQDIGARIIDAYPDATWRIDPIIKDVDEQGNESEEGPIATAVRDLNESMKLWSVCHRLDRLAQMGHYGVMLIGLAGGAPMDMPVEPGKHKLIYLSPLGERSAQITRWESDPGNSRFGRPQMYQLTVGVDWSGIGARRMSLNTHHSRVVHVAEKALDDEAIGLPRLERIWNRLMDLDKLLGGSAEVWWQNAAMLRAYIAEADAEITPEDRAQMQEQFEEMQHRLRRDLLLRGVEVESLASAIEDPSGHIDKQLDVIAGATGIPKRILIGNEQGELASTQDENNWSARIDERREVHAGPNIVKPMVMRLQDYGIIPAGKFVAEWPESDTLSELQKADIADRKAGAIQKYVSSPGADLIVPIPEFREMIGLDQVSPFVDDLLEDDLDEGDPEAQAQVVAMRRS